MIALIVDAWLTTPRTTLFGFTVALPPAEPPFTVSGEVDVTVTDCVSPLTTIPPLGESPVDTGRVKVWLAVVTSNTVKAAHCAALTDCVVPATTAPAAALVTTKAEAPEL